MRDLHAGSVAGVPAGVPIAFQMATNVAPDYKVGNLDNAIACAVSIGAHYVELPGAYAGTGDPMKLTSARATTLDGFLEANG